MKQKVAKKIQELCKWVSLNTVGRSLPPGIREKKISAELKAAVEKMRVRN